MKFYKLIDEEVTFKASVSEILDPIKFIKEK